ncbi:MAG: hypothetical protein AB8B51_18355 [Sedimentitalea sp.]
MSVAGMFLTGLEYWALIGALVAAVFLTIGIDRIDEDARGAYAFRPLLVPAILVIWPLVLWRWWVLENDRDRPLARFAPPRAAHTIVAAVLAVAVIGVILLGWSQRQSWPGDFVPEQISNPSEQQE